MEARLERDDRGTVLHVNINGHFNDRWQAAILDHQRVAASSKSSSNDVTATIDALSEPAATPSCRTCSPNTVN